jgi:hypothetical protein
MKHNRSNLALTLSAVLLCSCGGGGGGSGPHTVSVKVSGLVGSRLALQLNGATSGSAIGPAANGSYSNLFSRLASGTAYNITVATQPTTPSQTCIVQNGSGTISDSDITNVEVVCTTNPPRFLYMPVHGANSISGFQIDATSGALTPIPGSPFADNALPAGMVVDSAGSYAYVANIKGTTGGDVAVFTIDRGNGALTPYSDVDLGADLASSIAIDASGKFVFVTTPAHVYGFISDHGTLKAMQGSPFDGVHPPGGFLAPVVVDPLERFAYVNTDYGTFVLQLNTVAGTVSVTPGSPFDVRVAVATPSGKYVYAAYGGVDGGAVDPTTGALTNAPGFPVGSSNEPYTASAVDPLGKYFYAIHTHANLVAYGAIDPSTGAVNVNPPVTPVILSFYPGYGAIDPLGQYMYIMQVPPDNLIWGQSSSPPPADYQGAVSVFKIDRNTGGLTEISGSPFPALNPSGSIVISN